MRSAELPQNGPLFDLRTAAHEQSLHSSTRSGGSYCVGTAACQRLRRPPRSRPSGPIDRGAGSLSVRHETNGRWPSAGWLHRRNAIGATWHVRREVLCVESGGLRVELVGTAAPFGAGASRSSRSLGPTMFVTLSRQVRDDR
eukprot:gene13304-9531_t